MEHYIAEIGDHPTITRKALFFAFFLVFDTNILKYRIGEGVDHAVAGAGTDDEIISKRNNFLDIDQDNIFPLFVFQGVDDFTSKF